VTTAVGGEPVIRDVRVTNDEIIAYLADGRAISVPLAKPPMQRTAGGADRR